MKTNTQVASKTTRILRHLGLNGEIVQASKKVVTVEINGRRRDTSQKLRVQYGLPLRSIGHHGEVIRDFAGPMETGSVRMTVGDTGIRVEFRNFDTH